MQEAEGSSRVLQATARVPKSEKYQGRRSKSRPKPPPPKNSLAWFVALNKEPDNAIPKVQWASPPKLSLNPNWEVVSGELSTEAESQRHRETTVRAAVYLVRSAIQPSPSSEPNIESSDCDACVPVVPLIPIEERTGNFVGSSGLENFVGSQHRHVCANSLLDMLRGLDGIDLEVAMAAATTVAAVMESEQQIDTELLIKLLSDPEMVKKLVDVGQPGSNPGQGSLPAAVEPDFADNKSSNQLSQPIPSNTMPPQVVSRTFPPTCTKVDTVGNAATFPSMLSHGYTPIRPSNARLLLPPVQPPTCTEFETSGNAPTLSSMFTYGIPPSRPSNIRPQQTLDRHFSPVHTQVGAPAIVPICPPRLSPLPAHTHQTAGVNQVRPLIPGPVRPDNETMKMSSIGRQGHPNPYAVDKIKNLISRFGASGPAPFDRSVGFPDDHLRRIGVNSNPPFHFPNPLGNAMMRPPTASIAPPGISHFTPFPAMTNTGPAFHSNHNNYLNGHRIEIPDIQIGHNKNNPFEMNPKFQKPCVYFNTPKGCRNGANCAYEHDNFAKRMKFG